MNQQNVLSVDARGCAFAQLLEEPQAGGLLPPPCDVVRNTSEEHFQTGTSDGFITGLLLAKGRNL